MTLPRTYFTTLAIVGMMISSSCVLYVPRVPEGVVCPTANARQMILVVTSDWSDSVGTLRTFDRGRLGDEWSPVSNAVPVDIGRSGLGWGVGLHGEEHGAGPVKVEGDGRSPAGVFRIGEVFGFASADSSYLFKMPYEPLSSVVQCIDDAESEYYNLLVDSLGVRNPRWRTDEIMRSPDSLYRWGAFVDHNVSPRIAGKGSCIFLHIWEGPGIPTVGCTAMDVNALLTILRWLDAARNPVLVQLPMNEYERLRGAWDLPVLR